MKHTPASKLVLALAALGASSLSAQTLWNVATGGNWDTAGNWNPATAPNAIGADARITNLNTVGAYTITASSAQTFTVGRLDFGTNSAAVDLDMILAANAGLVFDVASGNAQLNLATGGSGSTMVINSAIQLNDNLTSTSVRNGGTQISSQFTGSINLQGNTWTINNSVQGLRLDGLISGTGGAFTIANDSGSVRTTAFNNTASTFSGGVSIGRANTVQLTTTNTNSTGTGGGGILGTGTISVAANSTTNDGNAATIQSNGGFFSNDYTDTTTNVLANTVNIASGRVLRIDTSRPMNFGDAAGDLTGSGRLVKTTGNGSGPRQVAFNYSNTGFTGTVEIQDGQIQTRVTDALAAGSTIVFNPQNSTNGAALQGGMASGAAVTIGSNLDFQRTASGHVQFISTSGNSTFEITGNFSNSGTGTAGYIGVGRGNQNNTVGNGGFATGANTGNATIILSGTGTLANDIGIVDGSSTQSILRLANTSGTQTFSGNVTGNGDLVRNGTGGTTILSGTNTYTGTTTITAGTLQLGNGGTTGSLATTSAITNSGTLAFNRSNAVVQGTDFSATAITGGAVVQSGSNNLTLNAANNFSGGATVNSGTLTLGHATNTLNNSAPVNVNGGTLALGSNSDTVGAVTLTSGSITGTGTLTGSSYAVQSGTVDAILGGSGVALTKFTGGTVTLNGANTYTGATNINAGTLQVNGSLGATAINLTGGTLKLGSSGSISSSTISITGGTFDATSRVGGYTVASGQTIGGTGTYSGGVTLASGATLAPGNSPGVTTFSDGLTLNTGSNFAFELTGNTSSGRGTIFDGTDVTGGTFTLQSGVNFNITFNGVGSSTDFANAFWDANQSWLVVDNANLPSIGALFVLGTVSNDSFGAAFATTGGSLSFTQVSNDVYLNYTAIPEPSTYAALTGLGMVGFAFYRRRRATRHAA